MHPIYFYFSSCVVFGALGLTIKHTDWAAIFFRMVCTFMCVWSLLLWLESAGKLK